jgi:hypothetical protein
MHQSPFRVFELETRIAEDGDGRFLQEVRDSLQAELVEVKSRINSGLEPEQFLSASQYASAVETAADILTKVWKREHPVSPGTPISP